MFCTIRKLTGQRQETKSEHMVKNSVTTKVLDSSSKMLIKGCRPDRAILKTIQAECMGLIRARSLKESRGRYSEINDDVP